MKKLVITVLGIEMALSVKDTVSDDTLLRLAELVLSPEAKQYFRISPDKIIHIAANDNTNS